MSRFLFLPMPGHGHVNPTLAVAAQLVARGHGVTYVLPELFRGAVTGTGAEFVPIDVELQVPRFSAETPPIAVLMDRLFTIADAIAEPLSALYDSTRPDVIVGESMSLWSGLLAESRSAPLVHLSASYVMSAMRERMSAVMPAGRPPFDVERLGVIAKRFGVAASAAPGLVFRPAPLTVAFIPATFHPGHDALDPSIHFVGPALDRAEQADDLDLPDGPLLYISLGTVFNDQKAFFDDCIAAFGGGDLPVVINHGTHLAARDFPDVPANVLMAPHVPQLQVLARSAAFITHGGMGSTMEAVVAGVPMVVVPQMVEQEITAGQVAELGMGVRLDPADVTPERLAAAVDAVTGEPGYREAVAAMGKEAAASGGTQKAADLVESAAAR